MKNKEQVNNIKIIKNIYEDMSHMRRIILQFQMLCTKGSLKIFKLRQDIV